MTKPLEQLIREADPKRWAVPTLVRYLTACARNDLEALEVAMCDLTDDEREILRASGRFLLRAEPLFIDGDEGP